MKEARDLQRARAAEAAKREAEETARKEAELAWKAAEEATLLQAQLQAQLQQLAAADAAAAQAFADRRAQMARESQEITQKLQALQNTPQTFQSTYLQPAQQDRITLPPHLAQSLPTAGVTSVYGQQQQGRMYPLIPATGLAEPSIPAQVLTVPAKTAPQIGAPRPGEAGQE